MLLTVAQGTVSRRQYSAKENSLKFHILNVKCVKTIPKIHTTVYSYIWNSSQAFCTILSEAASEETALGVITGSRVL